MTLWNLITQSVYWTECEKIRIKWCQNKLKQGIFVREEWISFISTRGIGTGNDNFKELYPILRFDLIEKL